MTKLLFVCHGNICRSPMAESVMSYLARERGLASLLVDSAATSSEEIGSGVHPGTRQVLRAHGIPLVPHRARRLTAQDGREFDLLIGMDRANLRNMAWAAEEEKLHRLLDWSPRPRDIADPWYTGDFETTFSDVWEGCVSLLDALGRKEAETGS